MVGCDIERDGDPMANQDRQVLVDFIAAAGPRFRELAPFAAGLILSSSYFQYR